MIIWSHLMCVFSDAGRIDRQRRSRRGRQQQQQQHCRQTSVKRLPSDHQSFPVVTTMTNDCSIDLVVNGDHNHQQQQQQQSQNFGEIDCKFSREQKNVLIIKFAIFCSLLSDIIDPTSIDFNGQMYPVAENFENIQPNYMYELDWTYCKHCHHYRPPGAHHCHICRHCILRMDHHCPWINNCVGQYNQKYFLQFTSYACKYRGCCCFIFDSFNMIFFLFELNSHWLSLYSWIDHFFINTNVSWYSNSNVCFFFNFVLKCFKCSSFTNTHIISIVYTLV